MNTMKTLKGTKKGLRSIGYFNLKLSNNLQVFKSNILLSIKGTRDLQLFIKETKITKTLSKSYHKSKTLNRTYFKTSTQSSMGS
jgi:hypothetical protein